MTVQEAQVDDLHESEDEEFVDELTPGTQLMHGQYTIESFLNSGGFGITYLARDSLDRIVVIKECFPGSFCRRQNASVVARSRAHQAELRSIVRLFTQEARSLAKAGHPNVVGVHQVFEDNGTAYMALDYVEGMDLLEIITESPGVLTPTQIRGYLMKMLDAISFVHKQGILHRDISPDNILVRADNEPVLIDFGAAREEASKQSRLLSALRVVKDGYSPQEFYVAGSEQSNSCDLYSLAASFYHIITGDLPPDSQMRLAAAAAGDADPYTPLGQRTNDFDEVFCTSLDKAMSVLPRERIQSAEDWLAMLKGEAPVTKAQTKRTASPRKVEVASRKSKLPVLLGSTAAVIALAAVGYFATQGSGSDEIVAEAPAAPAPAVPAPAPVAPAPAPAPEVAVVVDPAVPPAITGPAPTVVQDVTAPSVAADQDTVPFINSSDGTVDVASAPAFPQAAEDAPFVNISEPAAAPVEVVEAPLSLENLPEGVELVLPEPAIPELSLEQLPEGVELVTPAAPTATEAPAPEAFDVASLDASSVMGGLSHAGLPFTLSDSEPGVVASVLPGAPFWIAEGTRILTIDGQQITTMAEANAIVAAKSAAAGSGALRFDVATEAQVSGAAIDRVLTLPAVHNTWLLNGLGFESRLDGEEWVTSVTAAPSDSAFQLGDQLIAFMPTSERIDGAETLRQIIDRDLQTGRTNFSFAIQRSGQMWVESFNLSN